LTGGAAGVDWQHGWANGLFSASGLTIEQSDDNLTWYPVPKLGGGSAVSSAVEAFSVMLIPGLLVRALGVGTVKLYPGTAGTYEQPLANSPAP
jgi:hypothetical protein